MTNPLLEPGHWLAPTKRDPASRREAWMDLCQMSDHGQVVVSLRSLGNRWKWDHLKVRRFLLLLEERKQVSKLSETQEGTTYHVATQGTYAPPATPDRNTNETPVKREVKKKKHPLPEDWTPNDGHERRAEMEGVNIDREVEKFRNWAADRGERSLDWNRRFTNWIMRASEYGSNGNGAVRPVLSRPAKGGGLYVGG